MELPEPETKQQYCVYHPQTPAAATCQNCGKPYCAADLVYTPDGRPFCRVCYATIGAASKPGPGGLAIASLILSAASVFFCALTALPGFVIGLVELGNIKKGESPQEGRGLALAGAIIGGVVLGLAVLALIAVILVVALSGGSSR